MGGATSPFLISRLSGTNPGASCGDYVHLFASFVKVPGHKQDGSDHYGLISYLPTGPSMYGIDLGKIRDF